MLYSEPKFMCPCNRNGTKINQTNHLFAETSKKIFFNLFHQFFRFYSLATPVLLSQKRQVEEWNGSIWWEKKRTGRSFMLEKKNSDWLVSLAGESFATAIAQSKCLRIRFGCRQAIAWFQQFRLKFHSNRSYEMPKRHLTSKSTYWIIKRNIEIKSNRMEWNVSATAGDKIWYSFVC